MKLKEKEPTIVIVIRNGCFKGSDQIRRIPSMQSKHVDAMNTPLNPKIIKLNWGIQGNLFFIFLLQSGSNVYPYSMFRAKI